MDQRKQGLSRRLWQLNHVYGRAVWVKALRKGPQVAQARPEDRVLQHMVSVSSRPAGSVTWDK